MSRTSSYIISYYSSSNTLTPDIIGNKGYNLFRISSIGFLVPKWCIITSRLFDDMIGSYRELFHSILSDIDYAQQDSINRAASLISSYFRNIEFPTSVIDNLTCVIGRLLGTDKLFAVRSSAIGEDSSDNSYAGQLDSFLNVHIAGIPDAVRSVWLSVFSPRAILYRYKKNISQDTARIAVIIQEMVHSVSSGVLFTRDPQSRARECIISAGFGLGEGVVSNQVETDTFRIPWDNGKITKDVSSKYHRIVYDSEKGFGTRIEPVPANEQLHEVLSDRQSLLLRDTAIKIEQHFQSPQDIEWAYDRKGRLFILQARPIIFSESANNHSSLRIWDRSNIIESYPGLTLPLTFSFIRKAYEVCFRNASLGFTRCKSTISDLHIFKDMVGIHKGRVYYNLLNWYKMLSFLPGFAKHKKTWDQMIGIKTEITFQKSKLSPVYVILSWITVIWRLLTVTNNAKRFFRHFTSIHNKYKQFVFTDASPHDVVEQYEKLEKDLSTIWHLTLYNDFCAMKYYDWLKSLCARWIPNKYGNVHDSLLCGDPHVESVAPLNSILRLVAIIKSNPAYYELFIAPNNRDIWERIHSDDIYVQLKEHLLSHLDLYGDRGFEELKLERPRFCENPWNLVALLKSHIRLDLSAESLVDKEKDIRINAEKIIRRQISNPFKRVVLRFFLHQARHAVANRENMRFARSRIFGIVRKAFLRISDIFADAGSIQSRDDIFYLTIDEILGYIRCVSASTDLRSIITLRKAEYSEFEGEMIPDRFTTTGFAAISEKVPGECAKTKNNLLQGIGCSSGCAEGIARIILNPGTDSFLGGNILVARSTDPGWIFLMVLSKGIIVEKGSVLSHTAIIGRELGIPTIVGLSDATKLIPDNAFILMNGSTGEVQCR